MLIMDNDRMALMALQSILSKALPDFELRWRLKNQGRLIRRRKNPPWLVTR